MPIFVPIIAFVLTSNVTGGISDFLWPPSYPADSNTVFLAWEIENVFDSKSLQSYLENKVSLLSRKRKRNMT